MHHVKLGVAGRLQYLGKAFRSTSFRQTRILSLEPTERAHRIEICDASRPLLELETKPPTYAGLTLGDRPCMGVYEALFYTPPNLCSS